MIDDNNGPEAPYPGPGEQTPDSGEGHDSGLEQADSEPKQGTDGRQRTGIRHPEILALIKMPRQAGITAARNSRHQSISTRPSRRVFIAIEHATNVAGMDREKVI